MCMVRVDIELVRRKVQEAVADLPGVAAAYLFGSALGDCRPDSDIDIGLFLADIDVDSKQAYLLAGTVAARLEPIESHVFDVNVIDPSDTVFAFRVLSEGIVLSVNDERSWTGTMERVSRAYCEDGYRYRLAVAALLREASTDGA